MYKRQAEDWATRVSCYHLIGDANGNVRTGALRQFRDRLAGYSFVEGATSGETISLTVDSKLNSAAYSAPVSYTHLDVYKRQG